MYKESGKAIENVIKKQHNSTPVPTKRDSQNQGPKNNLGRCPDTRLLKVDKS